MSAGSPNHVSRRHLIALVGGAAGVLATKRATAAVTDTLPPTEGASTSPTPPVPAGTPQVVGDAQPSAPSGEWVEPPAQAAGPQHRPLAVPPADAAVLGLFGGLQPGSRLARWTVEAIHAIHLGAIPVVLRTETGVRFQVDVVRRDTSAKAPRGIAQAGELDFFLSNAGTGRVATAEEQGLATMALAAWVARRAPRAPNALLTLGQRQARFPRAGFGVLA